MVVLPRLCRQRSRNRFFREKSTAVREKAWPFRPLTTVRSDSWHAPYAAAALLVLLVAVGYANSLTVPFVFDDFHAIVRNPDIEDWDRVFRPAWWSRPRALVDFTFALQWHLHKNRVLPYHLFNVGIHGLNVLLAYALSQALFGFARNFSPNEPEGLNPRRAAFLSAAFFAVHPVQTQAVTYIVQRYASMSAFFYLGALLCFVRFRKTARLGYAFALCAMALASYFCKQNALTLPVTLLVMEVLLLRSSAAFWRLAARRLTLPALMACAGILWSLGLFGGSWSLADVLEDVDRVTRETPLVSRASYFYTQLRVLCLYLVLLAAPFRHSLDHGYPFVHSFLEGWTPLAALVLLSLGGAAWSLRRRFPVLSLAVFWFFSTLSLESSIFPIKDALVEHRLYLAVLGFGWALAYGAERLWLARPRTAFVLCAAVLCLLLLATLKRNQVWNDPVRLWQEAAERNPSHYRPANNLGRYFLDAGRLEEAESYLLRAKALNPLRPNVYFNLGLLYARREEWNLSVQAFRSAILLDPAKAGFHYNLGLAWHRMGRLSEARMGYEAAWVLDPDMEEAALGLASVHFHTKAYAQAVGILQEAMAHNPKSFRLPYHLSMVYQALGDNEAALDAVELALSRSPDDREALFQKAVLLVSSGAVREAFSIAEELQRRYPEDRRIAILLDKIRPLLGETSASGR